jgi:putative toxin-antitoxin system antitoxin component (TIGR02293 family)
VAKRSSKHRLVLRRSAATGRLRAMRLRSSPVDAAATGKPRPFRALVSRETPTAEKIHVIRNGVGARVVDDMVRYLEVPKTVVFDILHMPESTAHRLIRDNRRLDSAASERVVRVADVIRVAEEVFGGREAATRWLKSSNLALGDTTPLSMLDTEPGATEVRRVLSSISYGGAF